ncbi:MAG: sensor histidine kinase [Clostridia bacterium]
MKKKQNPFKSVRVKLFMTLSLVILLIISFLILVNNFVFGQFYLYSKKQALKSVYVTVNDYYNNERNEDIEIQLEQIAIQNNFDILIRDNQNNVNIYTSNKDFYSTFGQMSEMTSRFNTGIGEMIEQSEKFVIKKIKDSKNGVTYVLLASTLDNGYLLYIRIPITAIQESVKISNNFLYLMAGFTILIAAVIVSYVTRKFTDPILELNNIAKRMANLDFSHKYRITDTDDEINNLGKSINAMSDTLEKTIKQLRSTNIELEKDIEEKSKIDEMRKSFISDVSHELKTPIALIQGYSEGLLENVNSDEESRTFYAEVILDETNKMDKLVKQLLELMKLEYGKREFNDTKFDIVEVEKEVIRKSQVMLEEKQVNVEFDEKSEINVLADDFYIEQVITNYITNAIKHVKDVEGNKIIRIENEVNIEKNKVRVKVFNTGDNISEENINRIWNRFYKIDEARNRNNGGTGIGLSVVKAIMNNYGNGYGVINKEDGVEFYFDLDLKID